MKAQQRSRPPGARTGAGPGVLHEQPQRAALRHLVDSLATSDGHQPDHVAPREAAERRVDRVGPQLRRARVRGAPHEGLTFHTPGHLVEVLEGDARFVDPATLVCVNGDELRGLSHECVAEPLDQTLVDQPAHTEQADLLAEASDDADGSPEPCGVHSGESGCLADEVDLGVGGAQAVEPLPFERRSPRIRPRRGPGLRVAGRYRVQVRQEQQSVRTARAQVGDDRLVIHPVDLRRLAARLEAYLSEELARRCGHLRVAIRRDRGRGNEPLGPRDQVHQVAQQGQRLRRYSNVWMPLS